MGKTVLLDGKALVSCSMRPANSERLGYTLGGSKYRQTDRQEQWVLCVKIFTNPHFWSSDLLTYKSCHLDKFPQPPRTCVHICEVSVTGELPASPGGGRREAEVILTPPALFHLFQFTVANGAHDQQLRPPGLLFPCHPGSPTFLNHKAQAHSAWRPGPRVLASGLPHSHIVKTVNVTWGREMELNSTVASPCSARPLRPGRRQPRDYFSAR